MYWIGFFYESGLIALSWPWNLLRSRSNMEAKSRRLVPCMPWPCWPCMPWPCMPWPCMPGNWPYGDCWPIPGTCLLVRPFELKATRSSSAMVTSGSEGKSLGIWGSWAGRKASKPKPGKSNPPEIPTRLSAPQRRKDSHVSLAFCDKKQKCSFRKPIRRLGFDLYGPLAKEAAIKACLH